jgi:hypothetical protein
MAGNKKKSIRKAPNQSPALISVCGALWYTFKLTDIAVGQPIWSKVSPFCSRLFGVGIQFYV